MPDRIYTEEEWREIEPLLPAHGVPRGYVAVVRDSGIKNVMHCYYDDVDIEFAFYNSVWNVRGKGTTYKSIDDFCEQHQYKPFNVEVVEATPKFVVAKTGFSTIAVGGTVTTSSGRKYWFIRGGL